MSSKTSKQPVVPQAREALNKFKMEAANEVGVNLKQGYNGYITAREAGSVGGQMVNIMTPVRTMSCTRQSRILSGHCQQVTYTAIISA